MGADPTTGTYPHTELDYLLMRIWILWVVQCVCLAIILYCSWLLLDTPLFALVAASVVLATTIYEEHRMDE